LTCARYLVAVLYIVGGSGYNTLGGVWDWKRDEGGEEGGKLRLRAVHRRRR
jgi:hypothetical protein